MVKACQGAQYASAALKGISSPVGDRKGSWCHIGTKILQYFIDKHAYGRVRASQFKLRVFFRVQETSCNASQERYREGKRLRFERFSSGQRSADTAGTIVPLHAGVRTIWEHKPP